jgi:hypothetical protein
MIYRQATCSEVDRYNEVLIMKWWRERKGEVNWSRNEADERGRGRAVGWDSGNEACR